MRLLLHGAVHVGDKRLLVKLRRVHLLCSIKVARDNVTLPWNHIYKKSRYPDAQETMAPPGHLASAVSLAANALVTSCCASSDS